MEEKKYKILLAHPGRQHSFRVAKALKENGLLFRYVTTVYNKENSLLMRFIRLFLSEDNRIRANKRRCQVLEDNDVLLYNELTGYLLLLLIRIDKSRKIYTWLNEQIRDSFGRKVAKYAIKNNVDAVICYDTNAFACFELLIKKAPHIKRIIDHAHPPRNYLYKIYQEKMAAAGKFKETYEASGYILNKNIADYFGKEIKLADYHIVASNFSKEALIYNKVDKSRIIKAPYGVDNTFAQNGIKKMNTDKLKVLFVGEINQRKGIAQILEAAKQLNSNNINFNLIGAGKEYKSHLYKEYEPYVNFMGRVSFETLKEQYVINDIFVFPSMGEGFGLVLLEAMASGLPVIASQNCAGPDLIENGYNGFLIEAGDTEALKEKIMWFYNNLDKLPEMSKNARSTALNYTWENYEKKLIEGLEKIFVEHEN
jgi:glycosyltransferase involved in cell wall biosynthesis